MAAAATVIAPLGLSSAQAAPDRAADALPAGYVQAVVDGAISGFGELGLNREEALQRLTSQPARIELGEGLVAKLGDQAAGMWLDQVNNTVVVNVVDEAAAATVRSAGATANVVQRSMAELESIRDSLLAGQPVDTAVGIDVKANQVIVQVGKNAKASGLLAAADRLEVAVRVEHIDGSFREAISGGFPIVGASGGRCSLGFNTTFNTGVTAGHCTAGIPQWWDGFSSAYYGPSIHASFPGNDFGLIRNDGGLPQPGNVYLYNGTYQDIVTAVAPAPGQFLYKSGSTTGLTWGYVYYTGVTICYPQGCVGDLAQSNAYVQPGDSGGPWFNGGYAVGITSGIGGGWSFFQPVVEALNAYGIWVF